MARKVCRGALSPGDLRQVRPDDLPSELIAPDHRQQHEVVMLEIGERRRRAPGSRVGSSVACASHAPRRLFRPVAAPAGCHGESRDEDGTDTAVLLVLEHLVAPRRLLEGEPVRHEVRGVELATRSVLEEPGQVLLSVLLRGADREPFCS